MRVLDIMSTDPVTVPTTAGVKEAARKMVELGISGLPVVDDEGHIVGIVTEADFLEAEATRDMSSNRRMLDVLFHRPDAVVRAESVADIMTSHPVVIDIEATVGDAARLMHERGVKRLPVVDPDGKVVGIVSRADVMAAFVRPDDVILDEIEEDVVQRVLLLDPSTLDVTVDEGVVGISGTVPARSDARLLEQLIQRLEGVVRVESALEWKVDDTDRSQPSSG